MMDHDDFYVMAINLVLIDIKKGKILTISPINWNIKFVLKAIRH